MNEKQTLISDNDEKKLRLLIRSTEQHDGEERSAVEKLEAIMKTAAIIKSSKMPEDVVTMNSLVQLFDLDSTERTECWLMYSGGTDSFARVVPILSELGIALFGSREGDVVQWTEPSGSKRSRIVEVVYQPERLGNYGL